MGEIVGRRGQKHELEDAFSSKEAELIAVYGRRRVGKTYLIRNFFQSKKCTYFQLTGIYDGLLRDQLGEFTEELANVFYGGAALKAPESWMEAFKQLTKAIGVLGSKSKVVIFFDELPWLASRKSKIVPALEYYWNKYWSLNNNLKLVVCGSAASWIIKNIVNNKGGLHNRLTRKFRLLPFSLSETEEYFKYLKHKYNKKQLMIIYMVSGGVPFYLKNFNKKLSIEQNISKLFFTPDGLFFNEFDELFASLFDDSEQYIEIIKIIAARRDGVDRKSIAAQNKLTGDGGRLSVRLKDLERAGFISSYLPYGHKVRGVYYRISDEYCYFYIKWILPIKQKLSQSPVANYWKNIVNSPSFYSWQGYAFENICYHHLDEIRDAIGINASSLASPWRATPNKNDKTGGAQIDLLFERDDAAITVCEIKYTEEPFNINKEYAKNLNNKIAALSKTINNDKEIFLAFISASGIKKTMYSEEMINGGVVALEDLFVGLARRI